MKFLGGILLLIFMSSPTIAQEHIRLAFPDFPPFTFTKERKPSGIGVDLVKKALTNMGVSWTFQSAVNYDRALYNVREDVVDGFFLATENNLRNEIATLSKPFVMNRWSWFSFKGEKGRPDKDLLVGTILNTNTHKWLEKNGFNAYGVGDVNKLVALLKKGRISRVFLAEIVFKTSVVKSGVDLNELTETVEKERPFGVYIAKKFLKKYPNFLDKFNAEVVKAQNLGTLSL